MKLSSRQAEETIKCSDATRRKLVALGVLTDLRPTREGAKKHYSQFDSKQVNALARIYKPGMRAELVAALVAASPERPLNGHGSAHLLAPAAQVTLPIAAPTTASAPAPAPGITARLDRIEAMLQKLVDMWA